MTAHRIAWVATALFGLATLGAVKTAEAQSVASRVARVSDGTVHMSFALRPDICGNGNSVRHVGGRGRMTWGNNWQISRDVEWEDDCTQGPGRLVVDRRRGEISDVRFYVGGRWRPAGSGGIGLGMVPAGEAGGYVVSVAPSAR